MNVLCFKMNLRSRSRMKPHPFKERLREAAAEAILDAAEAAILERGLNVPMELIANRAGIAVGTLYNHFADRKALLDSLRARHGETLRADVQAAEERTQHLPVRDQLVAMLTAMLSGWSHIFLVLRQGEPLPDSQMRALIRDRFEEIFGGVLERGREQGVIVADPHGLQAVVLRSLLQGIFVLAYDEPKRAVPAQAPAFVVDMFLNGVAPKRSAR